MDTPRVLCLTSKTMHRDTKQPQKSVPVTPTFSKESRRCPDSSDCSSSVSGPYCSEVCGFRGFPVLPSYVTASFPTVEPVLALESYMGGPRFKS